MRSDAFGCVWRRLGGFRKFRIFLKNFVVLGWFWTRGDYYYCNFNVTGITFIGDNYRESGSIDKTFGPGPNQAPDVAVGLAEVGYE